MFSSPSQVRTGERLLQITHHYCHLLICLYGRTGFCYMWLICHVWLVLVTEYSSHMALLNPQYKLSDALNKDGYCASRK